MNKIPCSTGSSKWCMIFRSTLLSLDFAHHLLHNSSTTLSEDDSAFYLRWRFVWKTSLDSYFQSDRFPKRDVGKNPKKKEKSCTVFHGFLVLGFSPTVSVSFSFRSLPASCVDPVPAFRLTLHSPSSTYDMAKHQKRKLHFILYSLNLIQNEMR
jgi:hypothetical protein